MADVSVEFGATDSGLAQTLKNIQSELATLDAQQKTTAMSAEEFQKSLSKIKQLEGLETKIQNMATATTDAGTAASAASPLVSHLGGDMKKAGDEATDVGKKSEGGFLKMSAAVAAGQVAVNIATAGIKAAFDLAKASIAEFGAALDLGGRLSDLAARTGEAEGNLLLLERAFQNSGAGAEQVGPIIGKLQKFMEDAAAGGATQTAAMDRLGISYDELAGKTPTQQIEAFAQKISSIEDPGKRAATAMSIFGEEGGKLLPLLTNFSGELGTAEGQLGSMVDIMNRNAAVFDAVSDKINIVKGKFMEFAAGILDRIVPALDAVTEGLSRIDTAAIGQQLADAFLGGTQAMSGFQSAVDAFKAGNITLALTSIWESAKLQAMQTGNAIITNFTAAFKTVGDIIAEIFRADGPTFMVLRSSFDFVAGYAKDKIATAMAEMFAGMGPAFGQMTESLKISAGAGATAAELALMRIPVAAELAAEDIGSVLGNSTQTFKDNLAESESNFFDVGTQAAKVAAINETIATAAGTTNQALQAQIPTMQELVAQQQQSQALELARLESAADAAEAKFEEVENQIALNDAIAKGDTAEQKRLQNLIAGEKQREQQQQRLNTLVIEYAKLMPQAEAESLAKEMVRSETAAQKAKSHADGLKTNLTNAATEAGTVQEAVKKIAQEKMDNSAKALNAALVESRTKLGEVKDFIGVDMSKMSIEDIIKKLGLDVDTMATQETKIKAINAAVQAIADMQVTDITPTVDEIGVNDKLDAVKTALANINRPNVTPSIGSVSNGVATANTELDGIITPDVTPSVNESDLSTAVADAKNTLETGLASVAAVVTVTVDGTSSQNVRDELEATATDVPMTVKADQAQIDSAVGALQAEITNNFTGGEGGAGGNGGNGGNGGDGGDAIADVTSITSILNGWTDIISTIRDRLPMQALA
jgi:hypothetical protein